MKIKTITCHDVYNSGASLQAYALQNYLNTLGHHVEIIDYKPDYLSRHFDLWSVTSPKWNRNILTRIVYLMLKFPGRLCARKKKKAFDQFKDKYLVLTKMRYSSYNALKQNPPEADVYIAGSDQIWNTLFQNGRDAAFYLDFAPIQSKKISYAASFATPAILPEYTSFLKEHLAHFNSISVREKDGLNILSELGYVNADWVCDPVFLLSREKWDSLAVKKYSENYLLVYDFDRNPTIERIAKKIARERQWKIYSVNTKLPYADKNLSYAGPLDFLSLIRSSQMVLSNSFHGTAFAIVFEKDFYVIPRREGINTRMISILDYLALSDRMIANEEISICSIDYNAVKEQLNEHVIYSKQFLKRNLS